MSDTFEIPGSGRNHVNISFSPQELAGIDVRIGLQDAFQPIACLTFSSFEITSFDDTQRRWGRGRTKRLGQECLSFTATDVSGFGAFEERSQTYQYRLPLGGQLVFGRQHNQLPVEGEATTSEVALIIGFLAHQSQRLITFHDPGSRNGSRWITDADYAKLMTKQKRPSTPLSEVSASKPSSPYEWLYDPRVAVPKNGSTPSLVGRTSLEWSVLVL